MRKQLRVLAELGQETKAVLLLSRYFLKHFCRVEDIEIGDVVEGPKLHKEIPKIKRQIAIIYDSKSPYENKEGFTPAPGDRGKAIEHWLKNTTAKVDSYLIFDDETSDYSEEQMKHLICTRESLDSALTTKYPCYMGLQEKHIRMAKAMLED